MNNEEIKEKINQQISVFIYAPFTEKYSFYNISDIINLKENYKSSIEDRFTYHVYESIDSLIRGCNDLKEKGRRYILICPEEEIMLAQVANNAMYSVCYGKHQEGDPTLISHCDLFISAKPSVSLVIFAIILSIAGIVWSNENERNKIIEVFNSYFTILRRPFVYDEKSKNTLLVQMKNYFARMFE